jgi:hypothetical protein
LQGQEEQEHPQVLLVRLWLDPVVEAVEHLRDRLRERQLVAAAQVVAHLQVLLVELETQVEAVAVVEKALQMAVVLAVQALSSSKFLTLVQQHSPVALHHRYPRLFRDTRFILSPQLQQLAKLLLLLKGKSWRILQNLIQTML